MAVPKWADEKLSADLPILREKGEGQSLEFKEDFPQQAHELGREFAGFASAGGGIILIGVNNSGEVVGLNVNTDSERDQCMLRAQGILRTVRPTVEAKIVLAVDDRKTVLGILIGKQIEPVFYYDYRPYIREGRLTRPAEPEEVVQLVLASPSAEFKKQMEQIEIEQHKAVADVARQTREDYLRSQKLIEDSLFRRE